MNAQQYLVHVARTIATHGHRDVREFQFCASQSQLKGLTEPMTVAVANQVLATIGLGLKKYVPGAKYFDPIVAVEYATLTAHDNFTE